MQNIYSQPAKALSMLLLTSILLQSCGTNLMLEEQRSQMRENNEEAQPAALETFPAATKTEHRESLHPASSQTQHPPSAAAKTPPYTASSAWKALQLRLGRPLPFDCQGKLRGGGGDEGAQEAKQNLAHTSNPTSASQEEPISPTTPQLISYIPRRQTLPYVAREEAQKQLTELLEREGLCVISGHGGAGKTTLVAQYAYQHKDQRKTVYWLAAENPHKLRESFERMARSIGIDYYALIKEFRDDPEAYFQALNTLIYQRIQGLPLLLVLDNAEAETEALIQTSLAGKPDSVQVLITTRNPMSFSTQPPLVLEAFNHEEARHYVRDSLEAMGRPTEEPLVEALLEEVGRIPQALSLVMGYLRTNKTISLSWYLERLRAIKQGQVAATSRFVLPEVTLGLESLAPHAQALLHYCAYLDPDYIPLPLVGEALTIEDPEALEELASGLSQLSLVNVVYDEQGNAGLQVHREVQKACRAYTSWQGAAALDKGALFTQLAKIIAKQLPEVGGMRDARWQEAARYAPHGVQVALEVHAGVRTQLEVEGVDGPQMLPGIRLFPEIGFLLTRLGHYRSKAQGQLMEGLHYQKQALALRRELYADQPYPDLAYSWSIVGSGYAQVGDYHEALRHKEKALEVHRRLHPSQVDNKQKAQVLNGLSELYWRAGKGEAGLACAEECLALYEALFQGEPDPLMARAMNTVGLHLEELGRYEEALEQKEAALALRLGCKDLSQASEEGSYPDHLDVAHFLTNVGEALMKVGRTEEGTDYCQKALEMRQRLYGDQPHFHVAYSWMRVGACLSQQGEAEAGLACAERALEMLEETDPGRDHAYKALSLGVKGEILRELGRLRESLISLQKAMEMQERLFGKRDQPQAAVLHPALARTLIAIGLSYERQENPIEGRRYYERAAGMLEMLFPTGEHPELARVRQYLARVHEA